MGRSCGHHGGDCFSTKSKRKAYGCMAAFYHLFDFHYLYFTIDSPSRSKGLKLKEEYPPSTATYKDKQSLNIPVSMRVRTETTEALATDTSEICNSPGSKTPSLVARLMGLDLLPEKTNLNHSQTLTSRRLSTPLGGTRSLPVSPRVSSARKSDFDIHRLSLQLNKEKKHEEFSCSRLKQEIQSPRQILKQIKERVVARRVVGMDITNSVKNRETRPLQDRSNELRRDTTISCSPRTRFLNRENKPTTSSSFRQDQITQKPKPKKVILVPVSKPSREKQNQNRVKQKELRPINKTRSETTFTQRPLKTSRNKAFLSQSKASSPLHKKTFKKISKSSDVDNIISVTKQVTLVSFPHIKEAEEDGRQATRNYHGTEKRFTSLGEISSVEFEHLLEVKKLVEEGKEIVTEIERDIFETLVQETAYEMNLRWRRTETTSERKH